MAAGALQNAYLTQLLLEVGWPPAEIPYAIEIIQCESSGNPNAENSCCTGLFQIHETHGHTRAQLRDPRYNATVALQLWRRSGWQPWECHTRAGGPSGNGQGGVLDAVGRALGNTGNLVNAGGTGAIGAASGAVGAVTGRIADLTPDGLAELARDIAWGAVFVLAGGALVVVGLNAFGVTTARPVVDAVTDVAT